MGYAQATRSTEELCEILRYRDEFQWLLAGFISPEIDYRITDIPPPGSPRIHLVVERSTLGFVKQNRIRPTHKISRDEKILRRNLAWNQYKIEILEGTKKRTGELEPQPKSELVRVELINMLPQLEPSDIAAYQRDLEELKRLAAGNQPLPPNKRFHPEIERILAKFALETKLDPEQEMQMKEKVQKVMLVESEWLFLGIKLNAQAIAKLIEQERDPRMTVTIS